MEKRHIQKTNGRCLYENCGVICQAEIYEQGGKVYMSRCCPVHGSENNTNIINSAARYYWTVPSGGSACCSGDQCCTVTGGGVGTLGGNAKSSSRDFWQLASCTVLVDIVDSCNLRCPVCFKGAEHGSSGDKLHYTPYEEVIARIEKFIAWKGKIELLMLNGGEPTLHPQYLQIVEWAARNPRILGVVTNTNGTKFAQDAFCKDFGDMYGRLAADGLDHKVELYMKFDGLQPEGQFHINGADLRNVWQRAIENTRTLTMRITMVMTVTEDNLPYVWETALYAASHKHVRALSLQPMFQSGRVPGSAGRRINTGDVLLALEQQSRGMFGSTVSQKAVTPLPCSHPNCQVVAPFLRVYWFGKPHFLSLGKVFPFSKIPGFLRNRINFSAGDLSQCGCDSNPLADYIMRFGFKPHRAFIVVVKPFMDAVTWDEGRIATCCTHVLAPDGSLHSFCEYYSGLPGTAQYGPKTVLSPFPIIS